MARAKMNPTSRKWQVYYHAMVLPAVIMVFMFNTRTWLGMLAAFEDFIPVKGWFNSPWVGWRNFKIFFKQPAATQIIRNTLVIAVGKIVIGQITAIAFALLLNEVRNKTTKKLIQTAVYLPHFIGWVIYATILKSVIGSEGLLNNILTALGKERFMFLGKPALFPGMMILTDTIKEFGFGSIIYLSALTAIDPGLYEAAELDGASRWQQTLHVTIPGISTVIVLNAVLSLGNILNAGFDQIFTMYNTLVMSTGDVIDTWVYRQGLVQMNYGIGTAVGLFKSAIAMVLTFIAYWAADKFADYRIF